MAGGPRVTVVTAGHLATCPRMVKAADALHAAGYQVRVVSAVHTPWAAEGDCDVRRTRSWSWATVDYRRDAARNRQIATGLRRRLAERTCRTTGVDRAPAGVVFRAFSRIHDELVRAIVAAPADLVYGGTAGALAAVAAAARQLGVPYALDLEDLHSGEHRDEFTNALAARVEREVLPDAAFLTAGSSMIADAYAAAYGVSPTAIHNTFSIDFGEPWHVADGPLRLYWFSQTLGAGRGLEDVVRALGLAALPAILHLRARAIPAYVDELRALQQASAPSLQLDILEPAPPGAMVALARDCDLGLSCEQPAVRNHALCLGNKIFTYLAAGVPVVLSATPAQARLADTLGAAALLYKPDDATGLAKQLRAWATDRDRRVASRAAARAAAERRWHWEHPADRGALLACVARAVGVPA